MGGVGGKWRNKGEKDNTKERRERGILNEGEM